MTIFFLLFSAVDSLTLKQAIDIALSQSPVYQESKVALDRSRIEFYEAFSHLLPSLSATADYVRSTSAGLETDLFTGRLTVTQTVFDLDVIGSVFVSHHQLAGAKIQHEADIAGLVLNVKKAYYNLIYANELMASSETTIKRATENKELIETKYRIGAASKLDALQAEVSYLSALQNRARAKTLRISAQDELRSLLAENYEIFPTDTLIPPDTLDLPSINSLMAILAVANNNVLTAQEMARVAQLNLLTSYLAFLPKVSLFYGYAYSDDQITFDFEQWRENAVKNYGVSLTFPILELKSLIFNNLKAKKETQLQEVSRKQIIIESEKSLHAAYYGLSEAYEQLKYSSKSLEAAAEAVVIARQQYTLGLVSFLELLTAEDNLNASRIAHASALSDFYIQRSTLSYLLGGEVLNEERK
jgi:outer membrane protein TolC